MAVRGLVLIAVIYSLVATCYGGVLFSTLKPTLTVSTSPPGTVNLKAGEGQITVTWGLNQTLKTDTSAYKTVNVKLCYLPESQKERPWRKSVDELAKDKTCQHKITSKPYSPTGNTFTYTVQKDIPTAYYFVRAYVVDADDKQVAYGQTKDVNLSVTGISGRSPALDIASAVFSAFSVVSLAWFFYLEKKKAKKAST